LEESVPFFFDTEDSPVSAVENGEELMFNFQNWMADEVLHFLGCMVFSLATGLVYSTSGGF